jgi:hypothetical protein
MEIKPTPFVKKKKMKLMWEARRPEILTKFAVLRPNGYRCYSEGNPISPTRQDNLMIPPESHLREIRNNP